MSKMIVTHKNPDLDAIMSAWMLVRFDQPQYGDAQLAYVAGGHTYKDLPVDSLPDITHVDVGYGKFDHHQEGGFGTCASLLVWEDLVARGKVAPTDEALKSMAEHARSIDLFEDCYYPEASETRYEFTLPEIIPALHRLQVHDNEAVTRMVFVYLDGVYQKLKDYHKSRQAIKDGQEFDSVWGKGIAVSSAADDVHKVAQRAGYKIVVVGDPKSGYLGIKTAPKVELPLQALYDKITAIDDPKLWFYHNSGHMVLHGSDKGPELPKTTLTVEKILELIETVSASVNK